MALIVSQKQLTAELRVICTGTTAHPIQVCLDIEHLDPLDDEFDNCLNRLGKMTERDYEWIYNPCIGKLTPILQLSEYPLRFFRVEGKICESKTEEKQSKMKRNCSIEELYDFSSYIKQIKEDHMKKKSYWKWIAFKYAQINLYN